MAAMSPNPPGLKLIPPKREVRRVNVRPRVWLAGFNGLGVDSEKSEEWARLLASRAVRGRNYR